MRGERGLCHQDADYLTTALRAELELLAIPPLVRMWPANKACYTNVSSRLRREKSVKSREKKGKIMGDDGGNLRV